MPWVLLAIAAMAATAWFVRVFNALVSQRNACANARAGIDANLKKRHDLVPNLVRVVRGYAEHEREVLRLLTEARSRAASVLGTAASPAAEDGLAYALGALDARVEAHPDLKAADEFESLARTLTELEEQISASRRAFNAHVKLHNDRVQQFPTLLVARLTGFAPLSFFEADAAERRAPGPPLPVGD